MTTTPHAQIIEENCESCKAVTQGSLRASAIQKLKQERSGLKWISTPLNFHRQELTLIRGSHGKLSAFLISWMLSGGELKYVRYLRII